MRYFTPQLYQQFNSPDDDEEDRANEAWESAVLAYKQRLSAIQGRLPSQVVKLSELCLHDAEVLSRTEEIQPGGPFYYHDGPYPLPGVFWSAVVILTVQLGGEALSLIYCLWDRVRAHEAPDDWRFSKLREHWLYDEVDCLPERPGPFLHRVLLSTGVVLEIPFTSVVMHKFAIPGAGNTSAPKQSA